MTFAGIWNWLTHLNYGDVPTWVASVGTVGALWFAASTIKHQTKQMEDDRKRRDEEERQRKVDAKKTQLGQARQVMRDVQPLQPKDEALNALVRLVFCFPRSRGAFQLCGSYRRESSQESFRDRLRRRVSGAVAARPFW
ncbi:hypothetical protein Skr01_36770 [Sphaerisporangium krabiense]|uniref:Uncharacterized protein n=1 Tax=Sphaerisporangium krabiense TaxID=763782 RepID=A0A7W8Z3G3_9ACTN|nr:hypothetical protein [Sphaerisporangium krabiense]MBB5626672.1 hypothetical protein [Sphaerisporangium krabiense]GII63592.1 hypothetical protein Skr01_36770 [Sphaerisporangium krabiense]